MQLPDLLSSINLHDGFNTALLVTLLIKHDRLHVRLKPLLTWWDLRVQQLSQNNTSKGIAK